MECVQEAFSNIAFILQEITLSEDDEDDLKTMDRSQHSTSSSSSGTGQTNKKVLRRKKSVEEVYDSFDVDKTGSITYRYVYGISSFHPLAMLRWRRKLPLPPQNISELRQGLKKLGIILKGKYFRALVRFVDVDQTGRVNVEDFRGKPVSCRYCVYKATLSCIPRLYICPPSRTGLLKGGSVFNVGGSDDDFYHQPCELARTATKMRQLRCFMGDDSASDLVSYMAQGGSGDEDGEGEEGMGTDDDSYVVAYKGETF